MREIKIWMNGKFVAAEKAKVSIFDRGLLYGDGLFETMRSYAGVIFGLDDHLNRLYNSLRQIKIDIPYTGKYLGSKICDTLKLAGIKSAYIRLTITRGEGLKGLDIGGISRPNVIIAVKPLIDYPDRFYERGVSVLLVKNTRQNEYSPVSGVKSLNYLNCILARLEAQKGGFDEAILINTSGFVAEGASSNIFFVKKGRLVTPSLDSGILPGVTRNVIIEMAKRLGIAVVEKRVTPAELTGAKEIFLTNSLAEVLPVTRLGSKRVGGGKPGEITKLFRVSYQKQVIREVLHRK